MIDDPRVRLELDPYSGRARAATAEPALPA
jgi:hypothetical protein